MSDSARLYPGCSTYPPPPPRLSAFLGLARVSRLAAVRKKQYVVPPLSQIPGSAPGTSSQCTTTWDSSDWVNIMGFHFIKQKLTDNCSRSRLLQDLQWWRCRGILQYSLDSHAESPGSNLTIAAALLSFSKAIYPHCCSRPRCINGTR